MIYTYTQINDNTYEISTILNNKEIKFNCIIGKDVSELDKLVAIHLSYLNGSMIIPKPNYSYLRQSEYPPLIDYIDGIVKNDKDQIQNYIDACLAIKAKYPKD